MAQAKADRHDMRHHTALIQTYLDRGDTAGAREYLSQGLPGHGVFHLHQQEAPLGPGGHGQAGVAGGPRGPAGRRRPGPLL